MEMELNPLGKSTSVRFAWFQRSLSRLEKNLLDCFEILGGSGGPPPGVRVKIAPTPPPIFVQVRLGVMYNSKLCYLVCI